MNEIETIREEIDEVDWQIVQLIDRRTELAGRLTSLKREGGLSIEDGRREKIVLERVKSLSRDAVVKEHIELLYKEIISTAKHKQRLSQGAPSSYSSIAIVGKGMMGSSLFNDLIATGRSEKVRLFDAHELESDALIDSDLIILAVPTEAVLQLAPHLAEKGKKRGKSLLVADIASTKGEIHALFENLTEGCVEFVATHPMAGSEKSGALHAAKGLFRKKKWIVIPHANNRPDTLSAFEELLLSLGAVPLFMDVASHDKKVGLVSHFTRLLSSALMQFVEEQQPEALEVAGGGFASMTRLARGDKRLLEEMINGNKEEVVSQLDNFIEFLQYKRMEITHAACKERVS